MIKPKRHLFLCRSFRTGGEGQGVCSKKADNGMMAYLEGELADRGMADTMVSTCGCLKACVEGPVVLVYPQGFWVGGVDSEAKVDELLDSLQGGRAPAGCF